MEISKRNSLNPRNPTLTRRTSTSNRELELATSDSCVRIDLDRGGRLASLGVEDLELLVGAEAVDSDPRSSFLWGCYPMAPYAGRVRNGRFEWNGLQYQLELGMPPHAIHGSVFDRSWEVSASSGTEAVLETSLGENWPFEGSALQRIALEPGGLRLHLEVHSDSEVFPASLGWHPWFQRQLARGAGAELEFSAASMYTRDAEGIPDGTLAPPSQRPWDDCFTDLEANPRIRWPAALELELSSSVRHWVVYDETAHAICVEPLTAPPDVFNIRTEPFTPVSPGAPLAAEFNLVWRSLA